MNDTFIKEIDLPGKYNFNSHLTASIHRLSYNGQLMFN
jgi:hypothetical protein